MKFKLSKILMDYSIQRQYEMEHKIDLKSQNDFDDKFDIKKLEKYYKQFKNIKIDKHFYILLRTTFFLRTLYDNNIGLKKHGLDILFDDYSEYFTVNEKKKLNYLFNTDTDDDIQILDIIYKNLKNKINNFYYKAYDINKLRRKKYERIL